MLVSVLQPVIFASIAFFMVESGNRSGTLLYVALGAGLMGIWSSTLFGSGGAIQWQRWQGTLELMVGAPPPFVAILLPADVATATIGIYSVVATLVWGRIFFGVPLDFAHPFQLAVALPATILSLGMLGLLLASTFVLYRQANAFSNLLEYPVWLATGPARAALAAAGLGRADLVGALADLGHARDPRGGLRRQRLARDRALRRPRPRLPRARRGRAPELRAPRPQPRDALADMTAAARVFFVGGAISYRALFNWISPGMYVTTMLGQPALPDPLLHVPRPVRGLAGRRVLHRRQRDPGRCDGRHLRDDDGDRERAAVRHAAAAAGDAREPARDLLRPRAAVRRNGLFVSAFGFAVSWLLLDFRPAEGSVPALAVAVLVTTCSCVALGMLIGSIGLRARDVFFGANLVYFLMLLVCGVNIANEDLPGWLGAIGRCLPLTHGIEAAREIAAGAALADVSGLLATEALIGLAYATAAYVLFRVFEAEGRRRASLETY